MTEKKIPTIEELLSDSPDKIAERDEYGKFLAILNTEPPAKWLRTHPTAKVKDANGNEIMMPYLPIDKVEYLLTKIYRRWWVERLSEGVMFNSVYVTIRLYVVNPISGSTEWQDGFAAWPVSPKWASSTQTALPAAESQAIKDAAEKFGKIFGKDVARALTLDYSTMLLKDTDTGIDHNTLQKLADDTHHLLSADEFANAGRIINNKEVKSYQKLHDLLTSKLNNK